ncbi:MAG: pilin [Candidatus Saccharimonadales bacterium]
MKKLLLLFALCLTFSAVSYADVSAASNDTLRQNACSGGEIDLSGKAGCKEADSERPTKSLNNLVAQIINVLSIIVGVVAVIMVIIGGFKFVTSGGDSGKVASARNNVLFAIIGLVIVALAQFLIRFVTGKATSGSA